MQENQAPQIIPYEPNGNYEEYEKIKLRIIEKIEEVRTRKNYLQDNYKQVIKPYVKVLTLAKRNAKKDEEVIKYVDKEFKNLEAQDLSEERCLKLISFCDENIKALEKLLNDYFTEEIRDGYAYPNPEALIYCKIQSMITLD